MSEYTARETIYNGIPMRSRLEAGFAQWLDNQGLTWTYEGTAFGSSSGQYLPDFRLQAVKGKPVVRPQFIEVKAPGQGTTEVLERMKVILSTHADAVLFVFEGTWANGTYDFQCVQEWPGRLTYYVYNVPGCDSWHGLAKPDDFQWPMPEDYRTAAEMLIPDIDCWYEQEPRPYVLPEEYSCGDASVWAVAFHKGDAAIVSIMPLPWLKPHLVGDIQLLKPT